MRSTPSLRRLLAAGTATLALAAPLVAPATAAPAHDRGRPVAAGKLDLDSLTIPRAQDLMNARRLSSVRLTQAYLKRIRALDGQLGAVLELDPTALAQARQSDRQRRLGEPRSALEGIPVLLKDNIDREGMATTAGSRALLSTRPDDAELVRRLREAGAVVLGKTNLSEWANFRGLNSTSGWSGVGGQTNSPYVLDRNPCGSSSGSAVAVAAALSQVAIGTETDGSVVCPAAASGVVGLKPTLGLVSRDGIAPISAEQDTAGPMARHVVDAAIVTSVLQGVDPRDVATAEIPATQPEDYAELLDDESLEGARVGLWRPYTLPGDTADEREALAQVETVLAEAREGLEDAGATVVEVELPYQDQVGEAEFPLLIAEFARDLPAYLEATPGEHPRSIEGLIAFNEADPVELSRFDQGIFELAAKEPREVSPADVALRAETRRLARASIDEVLAEDDLDAIVAATNTPASLTRYLYPDGSGEAFYFGSSSPAAVAGYPNVTVPAGYAGPLPVGLSIFGERWDEADLLSYAYDFERETRVRVPPSFIPTIGR